MRIIMVAALGGSLVATPVLAQAIVVAPADPGLAHQDRAQEHQAAHEALHEENNARKEAAEGDYGAAAAAQHKARWDADQAGHDSRAAQQNGATRIYVNP